MKIADTLADGLCRIDFSATNKEDALRQMAAIAVETPALKPFGEDHLFDLLSEREVMVSTGLGGGVAIPHARIDSLNEFVVFALVAPSGVGFDALDERPVNIFFVVFAPTDRNTEHLRLLATLSRMIAKPARKKELLEAANVDTLQEVIRRICGEEESPRVSAESKGARKVLFIILFYEEDLQSVLEYLIEQGVEGAIIIEAKGMGTYVSTMPLFASFLGFMRDDHSTANTIMTVVDAAHEQAIIDGIESITGDFETKQGAMLISLEATLSKGTMRMI